MRNLLKRASWLELFYDLAFVALVAQLTYLTADNHASLRDALNIFIVGYTIFIAWWATTANRNLQDSEGTTDKLLVQLQMAGALFMSLTMPGVFADTYVGYFITLGVIQLLQVFMLYRMYYFYPASAPPTKNIAQGMVIGALLWITAAFLPDPYHYIYALMALTLNIFTPLTTGKGNTTRYLNVNHLQERLGLFLMLVMGEAMLVVALANTAVEVGLARPAIVLSGLVIVICLWWLYFEHLERCAEGTRPRHLAIYLHAHGFLFGSLILLAAGFKNALQHVAPTATDILLITIGLSGIIATIAILRTALHGFTLRRLQRAVTMLIFIITCGVVSAESQQSLTGILVAVLLVVLYTVLDVRRYKPEHFRGGLVDQEAP